MATRVARSNKNVSHQQPTKVLLVFFSSLRIKYTVLGPKSSPQRFFPKNTISLFFTRITQYFRVSSTYFHSIFPIFIEKKRTELLLWKADMLFTQKYFGRHQSNASTVHSFKKETGIYCKHTDMCNSNITIRTKYFVLLNLCCCWYNIKMADGGYNELCFCRHKT